MGPTVITTDTAGNGAAYPRGLWGLPPAGDFSASVEKAEKCSERNSGSVVTVATRVTLGVLEGYCTRLHGFGDSFSTAWGEADDAKQN